MFFCGAAGCARRRFDCCCMHFVVIAAAWLFVLLYSSRSHTRWSSKQQTSNRDTRGFDSFGRAVFWRAPWLAGNMAQEDFASCPFKQLANKQGKGIFVAINLLVFFFFFCICSADSCLSFGHRVLLGFALLRSPACFFSYPPMSAPRRRTAGLTILPGGSLDREQIAIIGFGDIPQHRELRTIHT